MRDGLRRQLKLGTEQVHAAAEYQVDLRANVETVAGYTQFLQVMADTTDHFAEPLDRSAQLALLPARSRELTNALHTDLASLGVASPAARSGFPGDPDQRTTTAPTSPGCADAFAAGVGYTLEGSALGARPLLARIPAGAPTSYLRLLVQDRRTRWTQFSRWLDGPARHEIDPAQALSGATDVFDFVQQQVAGRTDRHRPAAVENSPPCP